MAKFFEKLLGSKSQRDIRALNPIQQKILTSYVEIAKLSNDELRNKTLEFKQKIADTIREDEKKIA